MEKSRKIIYVLTKGLSFHSCTCARSLHHSRFPMNQKKVLVLEEYDSRQKYLARLSAKLSPIFPHHI
jgi:hypothetical protein